MPLNSPDDLVLEEAERERVMGLPLTGAPDHLLARRLVERFEWNYTPEHGSWLDMAESEPAIQSGQCLDRRIPDRATLEREVVAWTTKRNTHPAKADLRFTTADARIELKSLYPAL